MTERFQASLHDKPSPAYQCSCQVHISGSVEGDHLKQVSGSCLSWFPTVVSLREREKHYISSSHLGLIRCPTPVGVGVIIYAQTICDKLGNPM